MAAITADGRQELVALYLTMFGTAPSVVKLAEMVGYRENGQALHEVATILSADPAFALVASKDADSFAIYLADSLLAADIPASARAWAIDWVTTKVQGTQTKAQVISEAVIAIRLTTNPNYASSQAELTAEVTTTLTNIDNPVVVGLTINLTTGADNITGTSADDTINAFINGSVPSTSTLTGGDQVNGGGGIDKLTILVDTNVGVSAHTPALTSVENIEVRSLTANAGSQTLNLVQATGVQSVTLNNSLSSSGALNVTNAPLAATYAVTNTPAEAAAAAGINVMFSSVDIVGTADEAKFSVSAAGSKVGNAAPNRALLAIANASGVESITVATAGTNYIDIDGAGNDTKKITITGSGTNDVSFTGGLNSELTIDAAASTGANTFTLGANLTSSDVVKGGTGSDVLSVQLVSASNVAVTGVETLRIEQGSAPNANLSFSANPAFTTIEVRDSDQAETSIITGINAGTTVAFVGADTNVGATFGLGNAQNDTTFGNLRFDSTFSGAADVLNVKLGNQGVSAVGGYRAGIHAAGIETVNFSQSDNATTATSTLVLTNNGAKVVTASSTGNVALTLDTRASSVPNFSGLASTDSGSTITLIDFSAVKGTSALTMSQGKGMFAAASELKTAEGGMTFAFGEEVGGDKITVTGNKGVDNITTGSKGSFVANLADGNDVFSAAAIAVAGDGTVSVDGGAGDDVITGGANADTLNGGDGADILVGGRGADVINGGAGSDTIRVTAGTAQAAGTNQVTTVAPIGLAATEFVNVTIGGATYSQVFNTDVATTLADFVAAHANSIKATTGGFANGVVVTPNADQLVFTGTGTNTTTNGVMTSTGYSFAAPTATVTTAANSGNVAGSAIVNAYRSTVATVNADFDTLGDTFTITVGAGLPQTVTHDGVSQATSLALFAGANPVLGGLTVVATATTLVFYQTAGNTSAAPAVTAVSSAAGTGASLAVVGAPTDITTADAVAGVNAALPTASHSSYLQTGAGLNIVTTSTIDIVTFEQGDLIDFTNAGITTVTALVGTGARATITASGLATFATVTPATLNDALAQIAASLADSDFDTADDSVLGEAALFQFGGKTYVYISDAAAGHSAADVVIEIVGAPSTLTAGLSLSGGDISGIA